MTSILDTLVIETYQQLMGVLLILAIVTTVGRLIFQHFRDKLRFVSRGAERSFEIRLMPNTTPMPKLPRTTATERLRDADQHAFDRLATMISGVSTHAAQVSETQSKAALKIDTVEMAVHRMLADIEGIMVVRRAEIIASKPSMLTADAPAREIRAA